MIVKNEQDLINRCLTSIRGVDEIVILDTGSTDHTEGVAGISVDNTVTDYKYIAGVYKWCDDFAGARNKCLEYCSGDWILTIDADEHLEPEAIDKIRKFLSTVSPEVNAIGFETCADGRTARHQSVRLHRAGRGIVWKSRIHNYLSVRADVQSGIKLFYGWSPAHAQDPDRAYRILYQVVMTEDDCVREKFYFARELYYRKQWIAAIGWYKEFLKVAKWAPEIAESWLQIAKCHHALDELSEARKACLEALSINPDFENALRFMAVLSDHDNSAVWNRYADRATNANVLFR